VLFPAGEPAVAELQEQPVVVIEQAAAALVSEGKIDFVTGRAGDIFQRLAKCCGSLRDVHAENQRANIRQGRREGWAAVRRQSLRARSLRHWCRGKQQSE